MMMLLYTEPILKPLRSNIRFQELMRQVLGEKTTFEAPSRKYKTLLLNEGLLEEYQTQLNGLMSEEKPYLDLSLTLRSLGTSLNIPPNQLSQLLNEGFNKNFAEYVNGYRIKQFKSKVVDP